MLNASSFSGDFSLGSSETENESWGGTVYGIAGFDRALNPEETQRDLFFWESGDRTAHQVLGPTLLYIFDGRKGNVIPNLAAADHDLVIPAHFKIVHRPFLEPPWHDFEVTRSTVKDATINIFGFIPFGFAFCAYFSFAKVKRHPLRDTVLLGTALTFIIEITQYWIPTRDSSLTDVINNVIGTIVGVILFKITAPHIVQLVSRAFKRLG